MNKDFIDIADAAAQLAKQITSSDVDLIIAPISQRDCGQEVFGKVLGEKLQCEVVYLQSSLEVAHLVEVLSELSATKRALVVTPGVETGQQAHALAMALNELGIKQRILAVPVCPKAVLGSLRLVYQEVIALKTPLAPRSLAWHFEVMG